MLIQLIYSRGAPIFNTQTYFKIPGGHKDLKSEKLIKINSIIHT
jgi:hypothetical protein